MTANGDQRNFITINPLINGMPKSALRYNYINKRNDIKIIMKG
jgi:hypothetical protein